MDISVKEAKNRLSELLHRAESGERVVVTRDGIPVVDLVPHTPKKGGLNLEAMRAYKKLHGIGKVVEFIPADFDGPLPADFLIRPLPKA